MIVDLKDYIGKTVLILNSSVDCYWLECFVEAQSPDGQAVKLIDSHNPHKQVYWVSRMRDVGAISVLHKGRDPY